MAEITVQQTRKRIKIQQPFALATLALGVGLIVMGSQSGDQPQNNAALSNGILTAMAGFVWVMGLRVARWWFHD